MSSDDRQEVLRVWAESMIEVAKSKLSPGMDVVLIAQGHATDGLTYTAMSVVLTNGSPDVDIKTTVRGILDDARRDCLDNPPKPGMHR